MSTLPADVNGVNRDGTSVGRASDTGSAARSTYRHGDLRNALIEAGLRLAAGAGPSAVVLREATRQAGVSPNAAYRHFSDRDDLLAAVSLRSLEFMGSEIVKELAAHATDDDLSSQLDAVGRAYVRFALREPGLFRTAFAVHRDPEAGRGGTDGPGPFGLLLRVLDRAVAAGVLPAERRPGAEVAAWSAVHGLAVLLVDGPLRTVPDEAREALIERTVSAVRRGLFVEGGS
ncbi:TetR/AcrR family transcriptional regulator [uncultured Amnibacterium sp.]|uniref:TetR/AcrR family transcriptional regulator n=1 Tax=uncultured Amnibacterium sp. TaxID=1631851 RepID=UPI0035C9F630